MSADRGERAPRGVVALLCGNSLDFIAVRDLVTRAGDILLPINPRLTRPEIAYILEQAQPRAIYAHPALADRLPEGCAWLDSEAVQPGPVPDAIGATLLFTSGTTGRPKGCLRNEAQERARAEELTRTYDIGPQDVHLIACPLAHSAPGIFYRAARAAGARQVILPKFRPEAFLAAVERERATVFFLVPTQYQRLLDLPEAVRRRYSIDSVRVAIVAGAPIAAATKARIIEWLGEGVLWEFYGSSETGTVSVLRPEEHAGRPGSVGRLASGVELRVDGDGELFVRSPTVMSGYLGGPPPSADGFISVGDLGHLDADGYLYLIDRKHDTIISGGVNVYPAEVERALCEHPAVRGAVVYGTADPEWGQRVTALVATEASAADLTRHLRERLAGFKLPRRMYRISLDQLPIGSSGKPLRRAAADLVARLALEPIE